MSTKFHFSGLVPAAVDDGPCHTGNQHIRNTTYKQAEVPGYAIPRCVQMEVRRKFAEWCQRRGLHPIELDEGLWMRRGIALRGEVGA